MSLFCHSNKLNERKKYKMKIYDTVSHRSFDVSPDSVNLYKTRRSEAHFIYLHESADKWNTPQAAGILCPTENFWKKLVNTPRSKWV